MSDAETENLVRGFIRYLETLNKLKRTLQERRLKVKISVILLELGLLCEACSSSHVKLIALPV